MIPTSAHLRRRPGRCVSIRVPAQNHPRGCNRILARVSRVPVPTQVLQVSIPYQIGSSFLRSRTSLSDGPRGQASLLRASPPLDRALFSVRRGQGPISSPGYAQHPWRVCSPTSPRRGSPGSSFIRGPRPGPTESASPSRARARGPPQLRGPTPGPAVLRSPGPSHRRNSPVAGSARSSGPSLCSPARGVRNTALSSNSPKLRPLLISLSRGAARAAPTPLLSRLWARPSPGHLPASDFFRFFSLGSRGTQGPTRGLLGFRYGCGMAWPSGRMTEGSRALLEYDRHLDALGHASLMFEI
ncbi:hypothetical protein NDU88_007562 [Pleurodeles waltl]|uniref:Uncharacterized protein n=1 Tax=Pleurodeles waltl TaxID=8319 RepID=A0AAV7PPC9_PLEWA|nr:hypothetical protein NDU88_007562 [Pleurodeles waltl]